MECLLSREAEAARPMGAQAELGDEEANVAGGQPVPQGGTAPPHTRRHTSPVLAESGNRK
jgi:hypothetical protein